MIQRLTFITVMFLVCGWAAGYATTWQTRSHGYWRDAGTWTNDIVPPYSSADTIIIAHPVILDYSLSLHAGAHIRIDSAGALCGHRDITVRAGASILKFGLLEIDTMRIPGGLVSCKLPGNVIFRQQAILTQGGALSIDRCSLAVGPWFECQLPEYAFRATSARHETAESGITIYPNPASSFLMVRFSGSHNGAVIRISDVAGRTLRETKAASDQQRVPLEGISGGIYLVEVTQDAQKRTTRLIIN